MRVINCRICNEKDLDVIYDYGEVALADAFLNNPQDITKEKKYSLRLCICNNCKHIQIDEVIEPEILFRNYVYTTQVSSSIKPFLAGLCGKIMSYFTPNHTPRIMEAASNDGSLLYYFKEKGCEVLGIDPAENIADTANNNGIPTLAEFFDRKVAEEIVKQNGRYDVCIARNVVAHVKDLLSFVHGISIVVKPEGFAVLEFPHVQKMFEELQYDQVFHEHIGYHSLDSIIRVFNMFGMEVFDVEELWVHGGSLRVFLKHEGGRYKTNEKPADTLSRERSMGLFKREKWADWSLNVKAHRSKLKMELEKLKNNSSKIAVYGASGKGQTLLQSCGLDDSIIAYVVDKSGLKQGKLTPGTHLRIYPPAYIYEDMPDVILLCAWNFAAEIIEQEKKFSSLGGKFLHPFPEPHYLS